MTSLPQNATNLRQQLHRNGYQPIPVTSPDRKDPQAGKKPAIKGWQNAKGFSENDIARWETQHPSAQNTGVLCGDLVGIDIDISDGGTVSQITEMVFQLFGGKAPIRVGRDPRALIVCRTSTPMKKRATEDFISKSGERAKVEILGSGQQFVAFGIHPVTMKPYSWPDTSIENVSFEELPLIECSEIDQLIQGINGLLLKNGYVPSGQVSKIEAEGNKFAKYSTGPVELDLVKEALTYIPNSDLHYDLWLKVGFAIHSGLGEAGFDIWNEWSQTSSKYNPANTAKTWGHFKRDGGVTIGTLFHMAKQNGWLKSNQTDDRKLILVETGNLHDAVDQAELALLESDIEIFQRGGLVVRPVKLPEAVTAEHQSVRLAFIEATEDWLREAFTRVAVFQKHKGIHGEIVTIDCPLSIVKTYLARTGEWKLPILKAIIYAPTLRPDGSVVDQPGYDPKSGVYASFEPDSFLPIDPKPNRNDAIQAIKTLKSLFNTFPFASDADRSVVLATILTGLIRQSLETAPMFGFSAPVAGSGKSLIVDMISIIITGNKAAVLTPGKTEEELEKRLGAALMAGTTVVSFDNCTDTLQGDFLCQMLTQTMVKIRILGFSKNVDVPTNCLMLATGNNLTFAEDMTRRVLLCTLDPEMERPEERQFDIDANEEAFRRRPELVSAGLTVLRAFICAGRPKAASTLGSYSEWSNLIRSALVWLGECDPCQTMERVRDNDPVLSKNLRLLHQIDCHFYGRTFTTGDLIDLASERVNIGEEFKFKKPELHQILSEFSGGRSVLNSVSIGRALSKLVDRVLDGMTLICSKGGGGKTYWTLRGGTAINREDIM